MAAAKKSTESKATVEETKTEEKKPVTPREDPIARAQRQLQETIEKQRKVAADQLEKAREDLAASERNVAKAVRVRDERKARVDRLEAHAQGNAAANYAAALGSTEVPVYDGSDESPAEADAREDNDES
ncbi:hypothetical protein SEA_ARAXXI_21 [Microbacterium phage Araxxi]|uniref:Uncharacterized protein n=1 Tax=Microbacterium phage Araxxi TaxID=2590948 RepID=A0A516KT55_9CAUD|nr:hypothetical protein HWC57_gp21 [Microbacterium phage Araxxi]QDP44840.1 hypothetical protein SEA_ARAXXI_21 [Microbacterium phage Araxxi]